MVGVEVLNSDKSIGFFHVIWNQQGLQTNMLYFSKSIEGKSIGIFSSISKTNKPIWESEGAGYGPALYELEGEDKVAGMVDEFLKTGIIPPEMENMIFVGFPANSS